MKSVGSETVKFQILMIVHTLSVDMQISSVTYKRFNLGEGMKVTEIIPWSIGIIILIMITIHYKGTKFCRVFLATK